MQVGILMQRSKAAKVYFQQENSTAFETLLSLVNQQLPLGSDKRLQEEAVKEQMKELKQQAGKNKPDKASFNVSCFCVCVCVCVWVRALRARARARPCVCVFMYVCVSMCVLSLIHI